MVVRLLMCLVPNTLPTLITEPQTALDTFISPLTSSDRPRHDLKFQHTHHPIRQHPNTHLACHVAYLQSEAQTHFLHSIDHKMRMWL